jgi:hypothetical protein
MLTMVVSIAALAVSPQGTAPHWLQDLLASPLTNKIAGVRAPDKAKSPGATQTTGTTAPTGAASGSGGTGVTHANRIKDPAFWASVETVGTARRKAGGLLNECRFDEAYEAITAFRRERPDLAGMCDDLAADCANMVGRYTEAYQFILPFARHEGSESPRHLLVLSLASAGLGQSYRGQAEYCRDQVNEGLKQEGINETLDPRLARRTDVKGVAIMSCLALGLNYGSSSYLETALHLDQANAIAAQALVTRYKMQGRVADVQRVLKAVIEHLPASARRSLFEQTLREMR